MNVIDTMRDAIKEHVSTTGKVKMNCPTSPPIASSGR